MFIQGNSVYSGDNPSTPQRLSSQVNSLSAKGLHKVKTPKPLDYKCRMEKE